MRYFTCQEQKLPILSVFTSFLILGKIQQDGDYVWWRHTPLAGPPPFKYIPHLVQKKKGVPWSGSDFYEQKFQKTEISRKKSEMSCESHWEENVS